jgi:Fe-S cluster assembly protein SufD
VTHATASPFVADFDRVAATLPGAGGRWLPNLRRNALERFAETGVPTRRDEEWKYTSLGALEKTAFAAEPNGSERAVTPAEVAALSFDGLEGHRLVFVDGRYAPALSQRAPLPAGATLGNLGEVFAIAPAWLAPLVARARNATAFFDLNSAFMTDGLYLHLARDTVLHLPVHVVFIATAAGRAVHPRNLVVAESGAQAKIIEHYAGGDAAYFTNAVTQIAAADGASIEHYKVQQEGPQALHIGAVHASQARASRLRSHSIAFGAALARTDIATSFDAEGCEATLDGLYVVGGRQHVDHHTRIDHSRPHGTSREHYRGVLDGTSRAVFNGKVIVHAGARKTDAAQANHNLLLSRGAEVDTKPQLEIHADDVKSKHGATVGRLDAVQLFYLRSRGFDETTANALLTHAFARAVIDGIRLEPLRARVAQLLFARLPHGDLTTELAS